MNKSVASLSKMWLKVCNLEHSLFPELRQVMGALTSKEEKLIRILDFRGNIDYSRALRLFCRD